MPMLRTTFNTSGMVIDQARLYISTRGIYKAFLNGKRIGNDIATPA